VQEERKADHDQDHLRRQPSSEIKVAHDRPLPFLQKQAYDPKNWEAAEISVSHRSVECSRLRPAHSLFSFIAAS
jgi:hypothetical protein